MISYVIHDGAGRITQYGTCTEETFALFKKQGALIIEGTACDEVHYVCEGEVLDRPQNPAKLTGLRIDCVPLPSTITINGAEYSATDSTIDLDFTYPGTYTITVAAFPYLDATFTVTV